MYHNSRNIRATLILGVLVLSLTACSDSDNSDKVVVPPEPPPVFQADIVWTEYGIPHITAPDFSGAGYGSGYAFASLNFCGLMREVVEANGQTARYFDDGGDTEEDFLYTWLNTDERIQRTFVDGQSEDIRDLTEGYVAGVNRYLSETGVDNLSEGEEGCRDEAWVRPITVLDLGKLLYRLVLRGSADVLNGVTIDAAPTMSVAAESRPDQLEPQFISELTALADLGPTAIADRLGFPTAEEMGSNGYGIGADASQSEYGLLLSNTHFPWQGGLRWNMYHVTIADIYDVFGVGLVGIPMPVMGVNKDLAWTHTVAESRRFTFYELTLNPANPLQYQYDGEMRDIEAHPVSIERQLEDGTVETLEHTFYTSHYGPIVDLAEFSSLLAGWPNVLGTVMTYRDANNDNLRGFEMWKGMGQSTNMADFTEATSILGNPWTNTMAADRHGDALYGDISVMPHVTQQLMDSCVRGFLAPIITDLGVITLDGSDSACEWGSDEDAPVEGIFGYDSLPTFPTRDYGANSNNSYWVPNAVERLEGFPPIMGGERIEIDFRARQTMIQAEERKAGTDGRGDPGFNIDNLRDLMFENRSLLAENVMDDVIGLCQAVTDWPTYSDNPAAAAEACDILAGWDRRYNLDSVGSHIFFEIWYNVYRVDNIFAVPFDPEDPLHTPRDLNVTDENLVEVFLAGMGGAVDELVGDNIPLNVPWGEVQFTERNGVRIGLHGGAVFMFNAIGGDRVPDEGYSKGFAGASFIMATTWDETDCPNAYGLLTYSQSTDPASPHFDDSTMLYSQKGWIDLPFCEADITAQALSSEHIEE
jgi:acyl-homoserine-lactone acylase